MARLTILFQSQRWFSRESKGESLKIEMPQAIFFATNAGLGAFSYGTPILKVVRKLNLFSLEQNLKLKLVKRKHVFRSLKIEEPTAAADLTTSTSLQSKLVTETDLLSQKLNHCFTEMITSSSCCGRSAQFTLFTSTTKLLSRDSRRSKRHKWLAFGWRWVDVSPLI